MTFNVLLVNEISCVHEESYKLLQIAQKKCINDRAVILAINITVTFEDQHCYIEHIALTIYHGWVKLHQEKLQ